MAGASQTVAYIQLVRDETSVSSGRHHSGAEQWIIPIVEANDGRLVKKLDDAFICLFHGATGALRAALAMQSSVAKEGGPVVALSVATGGVREFQGEAFDALVSLAIGIGRKTPAGQAYFGPVTHASVSASDLPWERVGRFGMRGVSGDMEIFRLVSANDCRLPDSVCFALRKGALVRLRPGDPLPELPPDSVVLLEGFTPGSNELAAVVDTLRSAHVWLLAYRIATDERDDWVGEGRGLIIGTSQGFEAAVRSYLGAIERPWVPAPVEEVMRGHSDALTQAEVALCGLAFPSAPISDIVQGYSYDLLPDGRWSTRSQHAVWRVVVNEAGMSLSALKPGVQVDGRLVEMGQSVHLTDDAHLRCPAGSFLFRKMDGIYGGLMVADTGPVAKVGGPLRRLALRRGDEVMLGREPEVPGLGLFDRRGQDNIVWCSGSRADRARDGGLTLDRALTGRHHIRVERNVHDEIRLHPMKSRVATYVIRSGMRSPIRVSDSVVIGHGDLVLAGTSVVRVQVPE